MKYIIDIDNTICYTNNSDYENSKPDYSRIAQVNLLHEQGHEIHYYTARGGNSGKDWSVLTRTQLTEWGCRFNSINLGKPVYDVWVDDRAVNAKDFFK